MDKTPKYQKMCIEAFKDLGYIKPTASSNLMIPAPDSIHNQQADDFMLSFNDKFEDIGFGSTVARPVGQLYQQDQLQGMIIDSILNIGEFSKWALRVNEGAEYFMQFDSWEQLWLALVMEEKYNKSWDEKNEKWTKQSMVFEKQLKGKIKALKAKIKALKAKIKLLEKELRRYKIGKSVVGYSRKKSNPMNKISIG